MSKQEMVNQAVQELKAVVKILRKHKEFEVAEKVEELIRQLSDFDLFIGLAEKPSFDIDKTFCKATSTLKIIDLILRIINSF